MGGGDGGMPECIVCKADYVPGQACPRCGSDNSAWEEWKREELGALWGLLRFLEPHFFMPLLIAGWALVFGLLGMLWAWSGVKPSILVLAVALTFVGCILTVQQVYANRFALREEELLRQLKRERKKRKKVGTETQASLAPVIAVVLTILLAILLVKVSLIWEAMEWLVLEPPPDASAVEETPAQEQEDLSTKEKIIRAFPLICLIGYVLSFIACAYSSSLMLAREYARRLNERIPQPIFLQEDLLTKVVQREAGRAVHRAITPRVIGGTKTSAGTKQEARSWTWDEMERTDDGGIRLKAIVRMSNKVETSLTGERVESPVYVTYEVGANPWSRITKVARVEKTEA